jgi:hypothetical protein
MALASHRKTPAADRTVLARIAAEANLASGTLDDFGASADGTAPFLEVVGAVSHASTMYRGCGVSPVQADEPYLMANPVREAEGTELCNVSPSVDQ